MFSFLGGIASSVINWILILEMMWVTCVIIPFTILAVVFYCLNWLILDPFTNFLITGTFNQNIVISQITLKSPIVIITIIGLIVAFVCLIIFIINFFVKNSTNLQLYHIPKQFLLILGFTGIIIITPFGFILASVFIKFFSQITLALFGNNAFNFVGINLDKLQLTLQNLLNFSHNNLIDQTIWNDAWKNIVNQDELKTNLEKYYNAIINGLSDIDISNFIQNSLDKINNYSDLQSYWKSNFELLNKLQEILNNGINLKIELLNLNSINIEQSNLSKIQLCLGNFGTIQNIDTFNSNIQNLFINVSTIKNLQINENGTIIQTNNIAFVLYTATTGYYVNSIDGILANFTFIPTLFRSGFVFDLAKAIALSSIVALGIAKAIGTIISMLIYRWYALLVGIPTGYIAAARITNDSGQILKLWFREILTSTITLFIVCMNLEITYSLINAFQAGLSNKDIVISGLESRIAIEVLFCLFVVVLFYVQNSWTHKVLDTFNASATFKENVSNSLVSEYSNVKNKRSQTKGSIRNMNKSAARFNKKTDATQRMQYMWENRHSPDGRLKTFRSAFGEQFQTWKNAKNNSNKSSSTEK